MKTYKVSRSVLNHLKQNFGMEFFHRKDEKGNNLIQPISESVFKDMQYLCGKDEFEFVEQVKTNLIYKLKEDDRLST